MTRLTFGVSASFFAAKIAVKQNAIDCSHEYLMAAEVVHKSFYVDDCSTGAADTNSALFLQQQLTELFSRGGFILGNGTQMIPLSYSRFLKISEIHEKYKSFLKLMNIQSTWY